MPRTAALTPAAVLLSLLVGACSETATPGEAVAATPPEVPDFSGVWMAFAVENPDGDGNQPRYSEQGLAALDAHRAQFSEIPDMGAFCFGTGMPAVMLSTVSYPIEIVQVESRLAMLAEIEMQRRRVFLDGRDHPDDYLPAHVGHSIGTWNGDTLVIETALLQEWPLRTWPRTDETRIVERLYLTRLDDITARPTGFIATVEPPINDDVLVVDLTITDPFYYDGPQRRIAYYQRMSDTATAEYACTEGLWLEELERLRQ